MVPASGEAAPGGAPNRFLGHLGTSLAARFEALASGPTARPGNLARTKGGRSIQTQLVGDYKNPISAPSGRNGAQNGRQSKSLSAFTIAQPVLADGLPFVLVGKWAANLRPR